MLKLALNNIGKDSKLSMTVLAEASASFNAILIDDSQRAKRLVLRIVVGGEGECVECIEPAVVCMASTVPWSFRYL